MQCPPVGFPNADFVTAQNAENLYECAISTERWEIFSLARKLETSCIFNAYGCNNKRFRCGAMRACYWSSSLCAVIFCSGRHTFHSGPCWVFEVVKERKMAFRVPKESSTGVPSRVFAIWLVTAFSRLPVCWYFHWPQFCALQWFFQKFSWIFLSSSVRSCCFLIFAVLLSKKYLFTVWLCVIFEK